MASVFPVLLKLLRILRLARDFIRRFPGRCASHFVFLGRILRRFWLAHPRISASPSPKPIDPSFLGSRTNPYSVSDGSAVVGEYEVAASRVPASASASLPDLHQRAERQLTTAAPVINISPPAPDNLSVNPSHPLDGRSHPNRSSGNLSAVSIQSHASSRLSILTHSRESIRAPVDEPARIPRAIHRQFGRGPDPSRSRERPSRPPSPMTRPHTPHQPPRLGIDTNLTHGPPGSSSMREHQRQETGTSVAVNIQSPSTESFRGSSTHAQQLVDEPFSIDSETAHSSPISGPVTPQDGSRPLSPAPSATSDFYCPEGRTVQAFTSDEVPRYTKNIKISRPEQLEPFDVPPLTTIFPYYPEPTDAEQGSIRQDCSPWMPATHPDGALYFYDQVRRLFTDTDMHDPTNKDEIEDFYRHLERVRRANELSFPSKNYDLVLDIVPIAEGQIEWRYYYACHETRCLFWLEKYDASYMNSEVRGVKSPAHVKHRIEALYWNHWSLYPVVCPGRNLSPDAYDELMGILTHGCIDVVTSKVSTLPYDADTMYKMIKLAQTAKKANGGEAYYTAGATRLLSFFAHWRFLYFHGQKHARLVRDETVYDKPKRERSMFITLLSPLLFLAPEVHLREVEKLWTDEVVIETVWKSFMTKLLKEWDDLILWSTVMLTANVGFLAIPGVILSNLSGSPLTSASDVVIFTSSTQIASCVSIEASIASIVVALLLVRHNRTKQKEDPAGAATYLFKNTHKTFGFEPMAIIFSLPWALLMWSMVVFFIALLLLCFTISNMATRIFVGFISVLMASLIVWCIQSTWESGHDEYARVWRDCLAAMRRTHRYVIGYMKQLRAGALIPFPTRRTPEDVHNSRPMVEVAGV